MAKKQDKHGLKAWFRHALKCGIVYTIVPSKVYPGNDTSKEQIAGHRLERAWPSGPEGDFDEKLAQRLGFRITKGWRGFYRGGCGYNRPLDALLDICRECGLLDSSEAQKRLTLDSLDERG